MVLILGLALLALLLSGLYWRKRPGDLLPLYFGAVAIVSAPFGSERTGYETSAVLLGGALQFLIFFVMARRHGRPTGPASARPPRR